MQSFLCQDPLYKFEPVEVGGEIFAYCKEPGIRYICIYAHCTLHICICNPLPSPTGHLAYLQGFVFDTDAVTLESGAPVTRIMATCTPNIIQVPKKRMRYKWGHFLKKSTFPEQDLLPGWLWAPMDTTTELAELPFRPWNTSIPVCGQSHAPTLPR